MTWRFVWSARKQFVAIVAFALWAAPTLAQSAAAVRPGRDLSGMTPRIVQVTAADDHPLQPSVEAAPALATQGTNGLSLVGNVGMQINGSTVTLTVDQVLNSSSTRTSGTLRLNLWFSSMSYRGLGYSTALYVMGQLQPNSYFGPINQTVSFSAPPTGCYYVSVFLEEFQSSGSYEYDDYTDLFCTSNCDASGTRISINGGCSNSIPSCTPNATTACLLNNRFRATVRYRGTFDNAPADTNALVKPVTGFGSSNFETAFFYFNSSDNIEMLLKMLDQGNTDSLGRPTIALLFGSATPLRIELTITDMQTGATRQYTSNFGTQQGQTDFTAFIK